MAFNFLENFLGGNQQGDGVQKQAEAMGDTLLGVRDGKDAVEEKEEQKEPQEQEMGLLGRLSQCAEKVDLNNLDKTFGQEFMNGGQDR